MPPSERRTVVSNVFSTFAEPRPPLGSVLDTVAGPSKLHLLHRQKYSCPFGPRRRSSEKPFLRAPICCRTAPLQNTARLDSVVMLSCDLETSTSADVAGAVDIRILDSSGSSSKDDVEVAVILPSIESICCATGDVGLVTGEGWPLLLRSSGSGFTKRGLPLNCASTARAEGFCIASAIPGGSPLRSPYDATCEPVGPVHRIDSGREDGSMVGI